MHGNSTNVTGLCDGKSDTLKSQPLGNLIKVTINQVETSTDNVNEAFDDIDQDGHWFLNSISILGSSSNSSWRCPYNWWLGNDNSPKILSCVGDSNGNDSQISFSPKHIVS